jgi:RimJ/RimL family protein N-acetyltransferase
MFAITERLLLRPGWAEDAPALFDAIADEGVVRNLATAPWPYLYADAEAFLARERHPAEPSCLIFLRTGDAPRLVGGVGLGATPDGGVELGYWIARPFWGRGLATEAAAALVANARGTLRLRRLEAGHFLDNPASGAVLRKLGFRPTGGSVARHSLGRGGEAPCRLLTLDLIEGEAAEEDNRAMAA